MKSELINLTRAWDKEKLSPWQESNPWPPDYRARALCTDLSYENSWRAISFNLVHTWLASCILLGFGIVVSTVVDQYTFHISLTSLKFTIFIHSLSQGSFFAWNCLPTFSLPLYAQEPDKNPSMMTTIYMPQKPQPHQFIKDKSLLIQAAGHGFFIRVSVIQVMRATYFFFLSLSLHSFTQLETKLC